jgi:bacteriochlorophyllide a dehydrogenase
MDTLAVVLNAPESLELRTLPLTDPDEQDVIVEVSHSGISTGTERLLWSGKMPPFPGLGYPLVPGYESVGKVIHAGAHSGRSIGDFVFVPGARCFGDVRGLFGGAASHLVSKSDRITPIDTPVPEQGVLLALAATAYHALHAPEFKAPELIVGHGVLGRLIARICLALGAPAPVVWETETDRRSGAEGYSVISPDQDDRRDYKTIVDVSGNTGVIDTLVSRLSKHGEIVLAGFYSGTVGFTFPPAFMREARFRIAAEWTPTDLMATKTLVESGRLSLAGLISHCEPAHRAPEAYEKAFSDPRCIKMILNWRANT